MGLPRSTYYDTPATEADTEIVARITAICQHDLQKIATTDSDFFSNRAKDVTADRPNQLWVADITYVAIAVGFVYAAVILDAWSRRVVGYAIAARSIRGSPWQRSRPLSGHDSRQGAVSTIRIVSICGPVPSE